MVECFRAPGEPYGDLFHYAKGLGYAAVEMWRPMAEFGEIVSAAKGEGLAVASFTAHNSTDEGIADPAHHPRVLDEIRASLDLAAEHAVPGIIVLAGRAPVVAGREQASKDQEFRDHAARKHMAAALLELAPRAEELGVNLNLEVLNTRFDHPGYAVSSLKRAGEILKRVDHPCVKLLFDIYHVQIMEGSIIEKLGAYADRIGHIHTAGVPGRGEIDETQELNYGAIGRALADYEGYIGHELFPKRLSGRDALAQSFRALIG